MATSNQTPRIDQPLIEGMVMISRPWYNYLVSRSGMNILKGELPPTFAPSQVGDEYLDLTAKKLYKSFGVSSSTDWILIN